MADEHECSTCGTSFDTSRGLNVHKSRVHAATEKKKEEVVLLEMINEGKKSLEEIVDSLDVSMSLLMKNTCDVTSNQGRKRYTNSQSQGGSISPSS